MIRDLVIKNRSYRRFYQDIPVSLETLKELVDLARSCASGANRQPLKYILTCDPATNAQVFETLAWAGYLQDWPGPVDGERPAAYIVILGDKTINQAFGWLSEGESFCKSSYSFRSSLRRTFPTVLFGSSARNSISEGSL